MAHITIAKPPFTSIDQFRQVLAEIGEEPDGLQARYVAETDDGVRVVAVWESKAHADRFLAERLAPAFAKVLGPEPSGVPQVLQGEVANAYVRERVG